MKCKTLAALATVLAPLACDGGPEVGVDRGEGIDEASPRAVTAAVTDHGIGVLVAAASPAKNAFTAAANLARSQLNRGLERAGVGFRFRVRVASYAAGQAEAAALTLINEQGVIGMVADGDEATATVNRLNHELVPRIARKVPVTCYQCSSPRFNDPSDSDLGFADPEGWLFRTYFNAAFENPVQVRLVLARARKGDFDRDGHLKIVVYHDADHVPVAFTFPGALDSLVTGPHSSEIVPRSLPSTPESRAFEMAQIFDSAPDGHAPDAVFLAFRSENLPEALADYQTHPIVTRPPASANDHGRRDFLLPALLTAGGAGLEGTSMLRVAPGDSGALFRSAFQAATGQAPESTAAFLYDAVVMHAGAIGWAVHFGSTDPALILGNVFNVNTPGGKVIRPRSADFELAADRIRQERPINYDGAGSPLEPDGVGDNFPDLVHWKIQSGKFVEQERYRCDPERPTCARR